MVLLTVGLVKIISWPLLTTIATIAGGAVLLVLFILYERHLETKRPIVLLPLRFLKSKQTRAGLIMTTLVFFISGGLGFALVTYLQVVRQFDALHTGCVLMINAVGIVIFSIGVPLLIKKPNPRLICRSAIVLCFVAAVVVAFSGTPTGMDAMFFIGIFFIGASGGLLSSQAGVIVTSSISKEDGAQSGGIQGSMRNIGQAMGIALIGLIMISSLTTSVKRSLLDNPVTRPLMDRDLKLSGNIPFVTDAEVRSYLTDQHIDAADANAVVSDYTHSRIKALRISFIVFGGIILLFLAFTFHIPHSYEKETQS